MQVIASDPRFQVGVNIDGTLPEVLINKRLDRPFLWLQSGENQPASYAQARDGLMGGLTRWPPCA